MNLTYNQFEILVAIEQKQNQKISQRELAKQTYVSLGVVNKVMDELNKLELIILKNNSHYELTLKGYEWLEPHRVKRAIFIAAGFGSRLVPITLNTPKPLIRVHGKLIIETLLDAVVDAGIHDITIVRGYLGDQFDVLLKKYPMIKFITNPIFNESNNISSLMQVKDQLENAYVLESDLLLSNPTIIRKYEYTSNYLGIKKELTDDWCFAIKKGIISKMSVGGENVFQMVGISYWNKEDGKKLATHIENVFRKPGGKECYWDEVACKDYINDYKIMVRQCDESDIVEIDTFNELKQIDKVYDI
ncbi:MAG: NTP transferase domain-containing protein [Erysipelotrichaceae bacterium]